MSSAPLSKFGDLKILLTYLLPFITFCKSENNITYLK